jgi:cellulose synthase/poly-beta-1,6-N-acetylglucosamine synthase-like glycosyltransferase
LLNQDYPKDRLEIVVVDGMSEDDTQELVRREIENNGNGTGVAVKLLANPKRQRAAALNIGVREARGDVVMRVDAGTRVPEDYVRQSVATLFATGADNIGAAQRAMVGAAGSRAEQVCQAAVGLALSHPFGVGNSQYRLGNKSGVVDTLYLFCCRRELFDKIGPFDEESAVISEDLDMDQRIRDAGGVVYLNKDLVAYRYPRSTLRGLWRLFFRYGGAKAGFLLKRASLTSWRQWIPAAFVLLLLLLALLSPISRTSAFVWVSLVGSYMIADVAVSTYLTVGWPVSVRESAGASVLWDYRAVRKPKLGVLLRLIAVFPLMHVSHGLGFWRRLLQRPGPGGYWPY